MRRSIEGTKQILAMQKGADAIEILLGPRGPNIKLKNKCLIKTTKIYCGTAFAFRNRRGNVEKSMQLTQM